MRHINTKVEHRLNAVRGGVVEERVPLALQVHAGVLSGVEAAEGAGFEPIAVGSFWGWPDPNAWFKTEIAIPERFAGKRVQAVLRYGGESLAFIGGKPYQAIDGQHSELLLTRKAKGNERYQVLLEAFVGSFIYEPPLEPSERRYRRTVEEACLVAINDEVHQYTVDLEVALKSARALDINSELGTAILRVCDKSVDEVDLRHPGDERFRASVARAHKILDAGMKALREKHGTAGDVYLCGHSHIDTAWLWPLSETMRKCGRTFSTALKLMENYPDFIFSQSQPQLYEYTKENYPDVYEGIKSAVKKGQWEPVGCMWVEADTNVSGGEALVRQCVYGKRYFMQEFGIETKILWLPDVFGYSYALPQILKKCGVDYFMTQKISWNQYNTFPHHTFYWEGVDGTRILSHFPTDTYNGMVHPEEVKRVWNGYKSKHVHPTTMLPVGFGDGGGGVTPWMLDNAPAMKEIAGMPTVRWGSAVDFFAEINTDQKIPVWNDELYLELHRGTLTTQGLMKKNMRTGELLLREAEAVNALASLYGNPYPQAVLEKQWKVLLCNQFHDILPGSSVNVVYKDSAEQFDALRAEINPARDSALAAIAAQADTRGAGTPIVVFNSLSWEVTNVVEVELDQAMEGAFHLQDAAGCAVPHQAVIGCCTATKKIAFTATVPAMGYAVFHLVPGGAAAVSELVADKKSLENRFFRVELDGARITRLYDKLREREALTPGEVGNRLVVHEDRPNAWDAWDIDLYYRSKFWEVDEVESVEVEATGPVFASVKVTLKYESSRFVQRIRIYNSVPRVDILTDADWHEDQQLLKVGFPMNVHTNHATFEIAYGSIQRPNHQNTSWDMARFEVSGHKWTDMSEGDYGVSLLNDCKYGHEALEDVLRITLLRAPTSPDPHADRGKHEFTYSVYPHAGDHRTGGTVRAGYELNAPLRALATSAHAGSLPAKNSFVSVDAENVVIEALKKAEDSDEMVVRFYDCFNQRGPVTLTFDRPIKSAVETDMMEREIGKVEFAGNAIQTSIKPFEIKTIRLALG